MPCFGFLNPDPKASDNKPVLILPTCSSKADLSGRLRSIRGAEGVAGFENAEAGAQQQERDMAVAKAKRNAFVAALLAAGGTFEPKAVKGRTYSAHLVIRTTRAQAEAAFAKVSGRRAA